jgi:tetratricopeptide (TPR) repeat protein
VSGNNPRTPILSVLYQQYLRNQDSAGFTSKVARCYAPGTLERLARHPRREVRRAAVLALGFVGDYASNHAIGAALLDDDRTVRLIAENAIRSVWTRVGTEEERRRLGALMRLNAAQQHEEVIRQAGQLLAVAPWFAEAWYQRASAHFSLKHFPEAIRDYHEALELNPFHFVAATNMGQAYLELEDYSSALDSFRRALRLNPDLEGVRAQVIRLARMVEDK